MLTDEGEVLFKNEESRDSSELQGAKGGYGYTARIPLSEVRAGQLRAERRRRARGSGNSVSAAREIQFRVVPAMRGPAE